MHSQYDLAKSVCNKIGCRQLRIKFWPGPIKPLDRELLRELESQSQQQVRNLSKCECNKPECQDLIKQLDINMECIFGLHRFGRFGVMLLQLATELCISSSNVRDIANIIGRYTSRKVAFCGDKILLCDDKLLLCDYKVVCEVGKVTIDHPGLMGKPGYGIALCSEHPPALDTNAELESDFESKLPKLEIQAHTVHFKSPCKLPIHIVGARKAIYDYANLVDETEGIIDREQIWYVKVHPFKYKFFPNAFLYENPVIGTSVMDGFDYNLDRYTQLGGTLPLTIDSAELLIAAQKNVAS